MCCVESNTGVKSLVFLSRCTMFIEFRQVIRMLVKLLCFFCLLCAGLCDAMFTVSSTLI